MSHAYWRMCHQKTAPDSKADIKKEIIMVTVLRLALISIVISLLVVVPPVYAEQGKRSTSKLWTFPVADTEAVPGARSRLFRSNDEICMNISNKALPDGVYTVWWTVFNSPEHCTAPVGVGGARCGGDDDFANAAVQASTLWATGGIVGPDGIGYFNACLKEKEFPGQHFDDIGLTDAQSAEIHLIFRAHCEAEYGTPALLGEQITLFGGGCTAITGGEGIGGDCPCANIQFAVHPPKKRQHKDDDDD